jgi:hypothetical protein
MSEPREISSVRTESVQKPKRDLNLLHPVPSADRAHSLQELVHEIGSMVDLIDSIPQAPLELQYYRPSPAGPQTFTASIPLIRISAVAELFRQAVDAAAPGVESATTFRKRATIIPRSPGLLRFEQRLGTIAQDLARLRPEVDRVSSGSWFMMSPAELLGKAEPCLVSGLGALRLLDSACGSFHSWTNRPNTTDARMLERALRDGEADHEDFLAWLCERIGVPAFLRPWVAAVVWELPQFDSKPGRRRRDWREAEDDQVFAVIARRAWGAFRADQDPGPRGGRCRVPRRWMQIDEYAVPAITTNPLELLAAYGAPLRLAGLQWLWSDVQDGRAVDLARLLGMTNAERSYFESKYVSGMTEQEICGQHGWTKQQLWANKKGARQKLFTVSSSQNSRFNSGS